MMKSTPLKIINVTLTSMVCAYWIICLSVLLGSHSQLVKRDLGPRFNRILSMLPKAGPTSRSINVADIGCDHALLSAHIASMHHVNCVYACDISEKAIYSAKQNLQSYPSHIKKKVHLLVGDGLHPLLSHSSSKIIQEEQIDVLILSGMGVRSFFDILCDSSTDPSQKIDYWNPMQGVDTKVLDSLGVNRIICQPWPPNFLPLQAFIGTVLSSKTSSRRGSNNNEGSGSGWRLECQAVDKVAGCHYITSSFVRTPNDSPSMENIDNSVVVTTPGTFCLEMNPLYYNSITGQLEEEESACWQDYLNKQLVSLERKKQGINGNSEKYDIDNIIKLVKASL